MLGQQKFKRRKVQINKSSRIRLEAETDIKPWGNYLLDSLDGIKEIRTSGLGLFSLFSDELLHDFLSNYVIPASVTHETSSEDDLCSHLQVLGNLAQCSRAFYSFVYSDSIYRDITVRYYKTFHSFSSNWRETLKKMTKAKACRDRRIKVKNLYSDFLFSHFECSHASIDSLCGISRDANGDIDVSRDSIPRFSKLSVDEFNEKFAEKNMPCIITDVVQEWPAFKKWTIDSLVDRYGDAVFKAEAVDISLKEYSKYYKSFSQSHSEESPLYLFDKHFGTNCPELAKEYQVPPYFSQDLFKVLEKSGGRRPDYRWLIIGPARSGSTFHIDPNSTNAWNGVITGAKKWILFPPGMNPPGVYTNSDNSEVTSPQSLAEWFVHYYQEAKRLMEADDYADGLRPVEGICREGEMVFVPHGWWHCVMNISDSIAVTQNYVDNHNLADVLRFLRDKDDQVSGFDKCSELYGMFVDALKQHEPFVIEEMIKREAEHGRKFSWERSAAKDVPKKTGLWDTLNSGALEQQNETKPKFGFGFSSS